MRFVCLLDNDDNDNDNDDDDENGHSDDDDDDDDDDHIECPGWYLSYHFFFSNNWARLTKRTVLYIIFPGYTM